MQKPKSVDKKIAFRFFQNAIQKYHATRGRNRLPWRKKSMTPYRVWVSEVMLQQTQATRVEKFYPRFLKRFPDIHTLSKTSWESFLPYYEGLGYYRRGENMLKTARLIATEHGGVFPKDKKTLVSLPGVGEYTANAILSFAHGRPVLALDTNLKRVLGRYFFGSRDAMIPPTELEPFIRIDSRILNAGTMDLSNDLCRKEPRCGKCPLRSRCVYFRQKGRREEKPVFFYDTFPGRDAKVHVFLHKNHQEYYSSVPDEYRPFVMPEGTRGRDDIKRHFLKEYGLRVSVRPFHKRLYIKKVPVMYANAQILSGKQGFGVFSKADVKAYLEDV